VAFLALKVLCSVSMALILKHSDRRGINSLGLIRINYAAAAILAFALVIARSEVSVSTNTLWIAILAGVSYVAALVIWFKAIQDRGIALTVGYTRMSVIVPILFSMLVWREIPRWHQGVAIALGIAALLTTGRRPATNVGLRSTDSRRLGGQPLLLLLFAVSGVAALSSKLFQKLCPMQENLHFQALLFVVAFVVTSALLYMRKERTDRASLERGALLGAANLGSSVFMVLALGLVAGPLAFPASAAAEVAVIAVLGRVIWKEPLDRLSIAGLALTVAALLLVQIP
jgi:drug/metabolite transporter (DMT)-like permease